MKNKIWNKAVWLPAVLVALVSTSCLREPGTDDGGRTVPEGYGVISIGMNLDYAMVNSRAAIGMPETEFGIPEETHVGAVRMVLYGYDDHKVKYTFDFKIRTRQDSDSGIPEFQDDGRQWTGFVEYNVADDEEPHLYWSDNERHFITYAREVVLDDYLLLILINPTRNSSDPSRDLYTITAQGKTLADFETAVSFAPTSSASTYDQIRSADHGGVAVDFKFHMNNHRGLIYVPASSLYSSVYASNKNPIKVPVSRVVAKVLVENRAPETYLANASNFRWELDMTNKKTYWTRKLTNLLTATGAKGVMEEYGPTPVIDEYETWSGYPYYHLTRGFLWAEDPNFSGLSSPGAPEPLDGLMGEAREQKLKAMRWEEFNTQRYPGISAWDETVAATPALSKKFGDFTYCLENTMDETDSYNDVITRLLISCNYWPSDYNKEEGYFVYNSYYVTPSDMRIYAASDGSVIPEELVGLYEDIQALATDGIDLKVAQTASFSAHNVRYYHDGLNYYSVNILHGVTPMYGQYGVLRNNLYKITLISLKGPGSPTIEVPEMNNLKTTINILPWYGRTQFTEL